MPGVSPVIENAFGRALDSSSRVAPETVHHLLDAARGGDSLERRHRRRDLRIVLERDADRFDPAAKDAVKKFLGIGAGKPENRFELHADHTVWKTTYWPYADFSGNGTGNPRSNLWADGGPLEKFDGVLKARMLPDGAKAFEKRPALAWLKDPSIGDGYFIPSSTIREDDAERTTGVDFDGDGKLEPNVKFDFLDEFGDFGKDGKTTGSMSVGWWGSCDQVAEAAQLFKEPKKDVTIDGITFTPQDVKGLLTVIASCQGGGSEFVGERTEGRPDVVKLKSGETLRGTIARLSASDFRTGKFKRDKDNYLVRRDFSGPIELRLADGTTRTIAQKDLRSIAREDIEDPAPALFHKTVKLWLGQKRPFAMDHDRGPHVWNDAYDGAIIKKTRTIPRDVDLSTLNGFAGDYAGGDLCFYECELKQGTSTAKTYKYWIEKRDGKDVNSGWLEGWAFDKNPDFLWRPKQAATFGGDNPRNPFVLPALVKEIYEKSI